MTKAEMKSLQAEKSRLEAQLAGLHERKFGGASGIRTDRGGPAMEDSLRGRLEQVNNLLAAG